MFTYCYNNKFICIFILLYSYIFNFYDVHCKMNFPVRDNNVLHCIALHCIALHCIALHCIALHCIALHCIALHCIALHCIALHCIALYIYQKENQECLRIITIQNFSRYNVLKFDFCIVRFLLQVHSPVVRLVRRVHHVLVRRAPPIYPATEQPLFPE